MVPSWISKVVLAIAFAVMPLQGVAQTLAMLICLPAMAGHETSQTNHSHGDASQVHSHDHEGYDASYDGAASDNHSDHFCCNVVAPGLPAVAQLLSVPEVSSAVLSPLVHLLWHVGN